MTILLQHTHCHEKPSNSGYTPGVYLKRQTSGINVQRTVVAQLPMNGNAGVIPLVRLLTFFLPTYMSIEWPSLARPDGLMTMT